ncbi:hypothetical protein DN42_3268 [Vibrio cholerae]|nr:hypothetical protein DN42_3268 [Vibrio cholerae]
MLLPKCVGECIYGAAVLAAMTTDQYGQMIVLFIPATLFTNPEVTDIGRVVMLLQSLHQLDEECA